MRLLVMPYLSLDEVASATKHYASCIALYPGVFGFLLACGSPHTTDNIDAEDSFSGDGTDSIQQDLESDADYTDTDSMDVEVEVPNEVFVLPPVEDVPACGNRVLDEGEECDDGNRLDGDGCDWSCMLGDGDPLPDPDPGVSDYEPIGEPIPVSDVPPNASNEYERLPLVWTGSEYASIWAAESTDPLVVDVIFRRFSTDGEALDEPWRYEVRAYYGGYDLVWTGSGFGLFYVDTRVGLYYMKLDDKGKALGSPVLIEADPRVRAPAADQYRDGFIVSWIREMSDIAGWSWCTLDGFLDQVKVRKIRDDGSLVGPVVIVDNTAQGPPDIAVGNDGFGLVLSVDDGTDDYDHYCAMRFMRLSEDLSSFTSSGILGRRKIGEVEWTDGHWVTAWSACNACLDGVTYRTVAFFSSEGHLMGPPVINEVFGVGNVPSTRIAVGDGGLALVWGTGASIGYLRTDASGVAVGTEHLIPTGGGGFDTVWGDGVFSVIFQISAGEMKGVYLQQFAAIP